MRDEYRVLAGDIVPFAFRAIVDGGLAPQSG
jgi:hypothetical protein